METGKMTPRQATPRRLRAAMAIQAVAMAARTLHVQLRRAAARRRTDQAPKATKHPQRVEARTETVRTRQIPLLAKHRKRRPRKLRQLLLPPPRVATTLRLRVSPVLPVSRGSRSGERSLTES